MDDTFPGLLFPKPSTWHIDYLQLPSLCSNVTGTCCKVESDVGSCTWLLRFILSYNMLTWIQSSYRHGQEMVAVRKLLFLTTVSSVIFDSFSAQISDDVVEYITSLILYNSEKDVGTFDCWFYEELATRGILDPIVGSKKLAFVPKQMFLASRAVEIERQPSMLVFCLETYYRNVNLTYFLWQTAFKQDVRIIVFYSTMEQYMHAFRAFKLEFLYNVIFVRMESLEIRFTKKFKEENHRMLGIVPFSRCFFDQTSDLAGYVVKISFTPMWYGNGTRYRPTESEWINVAVTKMNGTYQYYSYKASANNAENQRNALWFNETTQYDISMDANMMTETPRYMWLPSMVPSIHVIVVVRGRELTVFETFVAPFRYELWIALLLLIISCCVVMLLRPNILQNNLILLALCGIEYRSLCTVTRAERFAAIALIILFYLLTCAFESKLIALMTSRPHLESPHTLDDLIRDNITIRDVALNDTTYQYSNDPRLKQIFTSEYTRDLNKLYPEDRTRAYLGDSKRMHAVIHLSEFYDFKNKRTKFVILDGFRTQIILARLIKYRSPLQFRFAEFEMACFEAGILQMSADEDPRSLLNTFQQNRINDKEDLSIDVGISELSPAWYTLLIGYGTAGLVLMLECCKAAYIKRKRSLARRHRPRQFL